MATQHELEGRSAEESLTDRYERELAISTARNEKTRMIARIVTPIAAAITLGCFTGTVYIATADAERARIHEMARGVGFKSGHEFASECIESEAAAGNTVTNSVGICRKKLLKILTP